MGMEMTCPKCHAKMRQFERNGVTIDQCTECRGIFLDRGELEHLIDADAKFNAGNPPPAAAAAGPPPEAASAPVGTRVGAPSGGSGSGALSAAGVPVRTRAAVLQAQLRARLRVQAEAPQKLF